MTYRDCRRLTIDGLDIRVWPIVRTVETKEEGVFVDEDAWAAEYAGIRGEGGSAEEAARMVREQLG
jgi:hypothetical protein